VAHHTLRLCLFGVRTGAASEKKLIVFFVFLWEQEVGTGGTMLACSHEQRKGTGGLPLGAEAEKNLLVVGVWLRIAIISRWRRHGQVDVRGAGEDCRCKRLLVGLEKEKC
jgi:hypothetical protein